MVTKKVYVSNNGQGYDEVLSEAEKYAEYRNLTGRKKIHIRLLAEELMGMVETIAGNFYSYFWIEDDDDKPEIYHLHLNANVNMDGQIRDVFLDASTSGKNAAAKGIMGKLRDIFQTYMIGFKDTDNVSYSEPYPGYSCFTEYGLEPFSSSNLWTLSRYKENVSKNKDERNLEDWDELEKSIIANLADDVSVGIEGDSVEMIITKNSAE